MISFNPFLESNSSPSSATFVGSDPNAAVRQLTSQPQTEPHYNNLTHDQLRALSPLHGRDPLDCVGIATNELSKHIAVYKKSGFASQFAKNLQSLKHAKN